MEKDENQLEKKQYNLKKLAVFGSVAVSLMYLGLEFIAKQNNFQNSRIMFNYSFELLKEFSKSYLRKQKKNSV